MTNFERISSALIYTLWLKDGKRNNDMACLNDCVNFVNSQFSRLPDYLKLPFNVLSKGLDATSLIVRHKRFCNLAQEDRSKILEVWSSLPGPAKDFILAYDTLLQFYICSLASKQLEAQ